MRSQFGPQRCGLRMTKNSSAVSTSSLSKSSSAPVEPTILSDVTRPYRRRLLSCGGPDGLDRTPPLATLLSGAGGCSTGGENGPSERSERIDPRGSWPSTAAHWLQRSERTTYEPTERGVVVRGRLHARRLDVKPISGKTLSAAVATARGESCRATWTRLQSSARPPWKDDTMTIARLITRIDPNAEDRWRRPPLSMAARYGDGLAAQRLLERGRRRRVPVRRIMGPLCGNFRRVMGPALSSMMGPPAREP